MRNHRLIDEAIEFLINHKNNEYYIDDIRELIEINQFGHETTNNLNSILLCLNDNNTNSLNDTLKYHLYIIINRNNGINCINKLICKE
jgi:hypothetical protein